MNRKRVQLWARSPDGSPQMRTPLPFHMLLIASQLRSSSSIIMEILGLYCSMRLEKESGFFFNMRYFEEAVTNGEWDEVEKYLLGFTKLDDNRYSMKMFFEIRKQKYLEALDRNDQGKSVEILVKDLKVFSTFNEELFKEITLLLTLPNFRENEQLSKYGDTKSARAIMLAELKKLIEVNPLLCDKLQFPGLRNSRLRTLINQSLNWQHQLCKNPKPNPDIKTLFFDHSCAQPNGALAPSPVANPITGSMPKVGVSPPLGAHGIPYPLAPPPIASLGGWMANAPSMSHQAVSGGSIALSPPANAVASVLNCPMTTPTNIPALDYQTADSEECHAPSLSSSDDWPKTAVVNLNQRSAVKSVDFNPTEAALEALEESVAGNQKTVKLPPTERTITVSLPDDVNLLHLPGKDVKFLLPLVGPLEKAQLDRQDTDVLVSQLICQTLRSHLTSMEVLKRVQLLSGADGQLQAEVERLKAENKGLKAENEALTKVHDSATHSRGLLQKMQDQESYFTTELSKLTGQIDALDDKVQEKEEDVVCIAQELAAAETKVRSLDELARANGAERDRLQVAYDKLAKELEEAQELVKDLTCASDLL